MVAPIRKSAFIDGRSRDAPPIVQSKTKGIIDACDLQVWASENLGNLGRLDKAMLVH